MKVFKPAYELTVRDFFARIMRALSGGDAEPFDMSMPVVKTITVTPNESNTTIWASGNAYDVVSNLRDSEIGLNTVALPRVFLDWALGAASKGSVAYDFAHPVKPEFPIGYWCENSDGSRTYYYHPRCKLMQTGNRTHRTKDNSDPDPSVEYSIRLLPTEEGVWRVRYYTANVAEGKVPLTPEEFFKLHPDTIEKIEAIPDAEKASEVAARAPAKVAVPTAAAEAVSAASDAAEAADMAMTTAQAAGVKPTKAAK